jgi:hypothetical protein
MHGMRLALVSSAVAIAVGVAPEAAAGGNSESAKLCQNNGWADLVRGDGTTFKNQGDCVSYAARFALSRRVCDKAGGTFTLGGADQTGLGITPTLWTCNGWSNVDDLNNILISNRCWADGGTLLAVRGGLGNDTALTCSID